MAQDRKPAGTHTGSAATGGAVTGPDRVLAHPVRAALLELATELGTVTSTEAARRLGHSSGLCSFHLRQLARYGYLEEAPGVRGRARPWQIPVPCAGAPDPAGAATSAPLDVLARELEDEGYRRWLQHRAEAPAHWRSDAADSTVLYLTPDELGQVATELRTVLSRYAARERRPADRPAGAGPVGVITRLFPLLPDTPQHQ